MKVIDLLNKIANGEEVPEKIKYNGTEYNLNETIGWYQSIDVAGITNEWFISKNKLNNEVEIIEEQQDIDIQEIEEILDFEISDDELYNYNFSDFKFTINELVQAVKQLDRNIKDKE